jgi:WD40 repeat protein
VCGLKWSPWGTQLASGGNDNLLNIWDDRWQRASSHHSSPHLEQGSYGQPLFRLERHVAAVKAIAWCPWQRNLLASGGGTADRTAACSDRRPPWAVPPSSAPAPPQGAPDGSGRRNTPRGRGRGHWAPRHCLGRSSEPPAKVADSTPPPLPRAGTIRFWNSNSGLCLNAVDTRSQACNRSNARLQPLATHARNRSNAPLQPCEYACNNPVT